MKIWAPKNLCHDDYKMLIFSKSTILFTLISQHSVTRKRPLFQLSLICHANYGFLFYLMGYNPLISLDWCSDCSRCGQWEPLQDGSSVHLTDTISFFKILFNFLSQDVLRLILYVPCPLKKMSHSSKELLFLLERNSRSECKVEYQCNQHLAADRNN